MPHTTTRRLLIGAVVMTATLASSRTAASALTYSALTQAEFVAAMSTVRAATAASEGSGWRLDTSAGIGATSIAGSVAFDPTSGRVSEDDDTAAPGNELYAERGTGTWTPAHTDSDSVAARKLLGMPSATHVLSPEWRPTYMAVTGQAASRQLDEEIAGVTTAVKTVEDDGSILYSFAASDPFAAAGEPVDGAGFSIAVDIHTTVDNVIVGETVTASVPLFGSSSVEVAISYGSQQITVPSPADSVPQADLDRALNAVHLKTIVADTATRVSHTAATIARHAHRTIVAADIVLAARRVVKGARVHITVTPIRAGVRLSSVNPFTHATVSSTVVVEPAAVVHSG